MTGACVRIAALVLHCTLLLPSSAAGQAVAGRLHHDGVPLRGAFVRLLTEAGEQHAAVLTDSIGRFFVRARVPGTYRLQAEFIGFASHMSGPLHIGPTTVTHDISLSVQPVQLPFVRADGRRVCGSGAGGAETQRLWEEIRKALSITAWAALDSGQTFWTLLQYTREYDRNMRAVKREDRRVQRASALAPFGVAPALDFVNRGFLRHESGDTLLAGPDAALLLSDDFLEHYCFRLRANPGTGLVGLAFEPQRSRRTTDIRGTLWVDPGTAELQHLDYEYIQLPENIEPYGASGHVKFDRLQNGMWIVSRWWIRTPIVAQPSRALRDRTGALVTSQEGVREDGGIVIALADAANNPLPWNKGTGVLDGRVHDAARWAPLAGATVLLLGTPHEARTDERGSFRIEAIPSGVYGATFTHPMLTLAAVSVPIDSVSIAAGMVSRHEFTTPGIVDLLRQTCPGEAEDHTRGSTGLVLGRWVGDTPGHQVEIVARWRGPPLGGAGQVDRWRTVRPGSDGRYALCWLPEDTAISLWVRDGVSRPEREFRRVVLPSTDRILVLDVR